jgi:hypothetical protein
MQTMTNIPQAFISFRFLSKNFRGLKKMWRLIPLQAMKNRRSPIRQGLAAPLLTQSRLSRVSPMLVGSPPASRRTRAIKFTMCDANEGPKERFFDATEVDEGRPLDVGRQRLASNQAVRLGFKRSWS